MTAQEIELRKPVWIAMSDLFLDTDVRLSYPATACVLADSPFTINELELIFKKEVAPVVGWNLWAMMGAWDGFDENWLVSRIAPRVGAKFWLPSFAPTPHNDWKAMVILVEALRRLPVPGRSRQVALWVQLSKFFIVRTGAAVVKGWTPEELDAAWRDEMWPTYGLSVDEYVKYSAEACPDKQEIEQAWTLFRNAVS